MASYAIVGPLYWHFCITIRHLSSHSVLFHISSLLPDRFLFPGWPASPALFSAANLRREKSGKTKKLSRFESNKLCVGDRIHFFYFFIFPWFLSLSERFFDPLLMTPSSFLPSPSHTNSHKLAFTSWKRWALKSARNTECGFCIGFTTCQTIVCGWNHNGVFSPFFPPSSFYIFIFDAVLSILFYDNLYSFGLLLLPLPSDHPS